MGVAGACRGVELCQLQNEDVQVQDFHLVVTVRNTKNQTDRCFIVKNSKESNATDVVKICKSYMALRPTNLTISRYFIGYKDGKCLSQPVGKNTFGLFPRKIAAFLNLPEAVSYTGHCFRRTSASLLADSGANIDQLKRHGGWKSATVAEGYVEQSIENKKNVADKIFSQNLRTDVKSHKSQGQSRTVTVCNFPEPTINEDSSTDHTEPAIFGSPLQNINLNQQRSEIDSDSRSLIHLVGCSGAILNINITNNNNVKQRRNV